MVGACSSSDSKDSGSDNKGTGGKAAAETDAGTGAPCGSKLCKGTETAEPCCIDQFEGTCGFKTAAGQCVATAPPAPSDCPRFAPMAGITLNGCCTTDKKCGIDVSQFSPTTGCIENGAFKTSSQQMGFLGDASAVMFPAPQACP